jgi:hypothetical protein
MRAHSSLLLPHLRRLRSVGTLAGHPDWPVAKSPGDVDTVDHLVASLYDVVSAPAGQRDWDRFRALFVPDGRLAWIDPESAATKDAPASMGDAVFLTPDTVHAAKRFLTSRRTVSSSAASSSPSRGVWQSCRGVEYEGKPGCEGRRPAILARHRFVPDCACSRTLLDRQPHL